MYKFDTILYGTSYYHEYLPVERLEHDVCLMQEAGINIVRLGESTWSLFEPEEGRFEFAWMDKIINRMHAAGIRVLLGTPTYSIPAWLATRHPHILNQRKDGSKVGYGIRQNFDFTDAAYLFYAERIIRRMIGHWAQHPAIIGFQVDNETGVRGTANHNYFRGFVNYVKGKYRTVRNLNQMWGLNFWGMSLNDWDEFPVPTSISNPCYLTAWECYNQKMTADFIEWQTTLVNEYKREDQFVTHNFFTVMRSANHALAARPLDLAAVNIYHGTQNEVNGEDVVWADDFFRSVKRTNHLITETSAQGGGWDAKNVVPFFDGQARLFVYSHLASGANMMLYWHWHSLHYGRETYWKGVLGHDLTPGRLYREVKGVADELKVAGPKLVNLEIRNSAAVLYSSVSEISSSFMPYMEGDVYLSGILQFHKAAFRNNIGTDFVFPGDCDLDRYKLLLVPQLYSATDETLHRIAKFVETGGTAVISVRSGFCNEEAVVRAETAPGPLREACGFHYREFSRIGSLALKGDPFHVGEEKNKVSEWAEFIMLETAKALAYYEAPFFERFPAVVENSFGSGKVIYVGCHVTDEILCEIVRHAAKLARLDLQPVRYPVVIRSGINDQGRNIHYFLNYSNEVQAFEYPFRRASNLLRAGDVLPGATIVLEPWDVLVLEE